MFDKRVLPASIGVVAVFFLIGGSFVIQSPRDDGTIAGLRRRLSSVYDRQLIADPKTIHFKSDLPAVVSDMLHTDEVAVAKSSSSGVVDETSSDPGNFWCTEPNVDPLPYNNCNADDIIYRIPLEGGMTNAIKMVLLGAIQAFEENRCFFIDEGSSHLNNFDKVNYHDNGFIAHYFERIGLYNEDPRVQKALTENRILSLTWKQVWVPPRNRRMYDQVTSIPSLGYENMPGHQLKAIMLKRMWRPLPHIREQTCKKFYQLLGRQDFMAMSVRRGDKTTENFDFVSMEKYILAAEVAIRDQFKNVPPVIFVATDDCTVLPTLRSSRPTWQFLSECDTSHQENGFDLRDMAKWGQTEYDEHYGKFFSELFAMAAAKYWIGVTYTNVSWFVFFMRGGRMENFELLDAPAGTNQVLQNW